MTTIAYKDGIIAYDSRATEGSRIVTDSYNKRVDRDGVTFVICGSLMDVDRGVAAWFGDIDSRDELDFAALVVDQDGVAWAFECLDDGVCQKLRAADFGSLAIGSGTPHALTAMDLGCSAKEAVKMASKRDSGTGGRIRTVRAKG